VDEGEERWPARCCPPADQADPPVPKVVAPRADADGWAETRTSGCRASKLHRSGHPVGATWDSPRRAGDPGQGPGPRWSKLRRRGFGIAARIGEVLAKIRRADSPPWGFPNLPPASQPYVVDEVGTRAVPAGRQVWRRSEGPPRASLAGRAAGPSSAVVDPGAAPRCEPTRSRGPDASSLRRKRHGSLNSWVLEGLGRET
jgi:hypothetical protein